MHNNYMAWRPYENLIEGVLDNSKPVKINGWMKFLGCKEKIKFNLDSDFLEDIRGSVIKILNPNPSFRNGDENYMNGFSIIQKGTAGDITGGLRPQPYVDYPYIEWYSEKNGRVVLELDPGQLEIIKQPPKTLNKKTTKELEKDQLAKKKAMFEHLKGCVEIHEAQK